MNLKKYIFIIIGVLILLIPPFFDILRGNMVIVIGVKSIISFMLGILFIATGITYIRKGPSKDKSYYKIILLFIFFIHITGVLFNFPLNDIMSKYPVATVDYSFHFYQAYATSNFFLTSHQLWGYDPYFMAGYPMGIIFDMNYKFFELFVSIFSFIGTVPASKLFLLIFMIIMPLVAFSSCRNLGLGKTESIIGTCLAVLLWYTDSSLSHNRWEGMFSNVFIAYLSIYVFSLLFKYMETKKLYVFVLMVLSGTIVFYMGTSVFVLSLPVFLLFILLVREKNYRVCIVFVIWGLLMLVLITPWFIPCLKFLHYKTDSGYWFYADIGTFFKDFISYEGCPPGSGWPRTFFIRSLIFFTGVYGIYLWIKEKQPMKYIPITANALAMFLLSYLGSYSKLILNLQPYRFISSMSFFLLVPSAKAIHFLYNRSKENLKKETLIAITILGLLSLPQIYAGISLAFRTPPISAIFSREDIEIKLWIKKHTDNSARILYEDSFRNEHPSLLPYYIKRQFIGGLYPKTFIKHGFVELNSWSMFDKKFSDISLAQMKNYFEYYNIKWVFAFTKEVLDLFDKYPSYLKKITRIGTVNVYEVDRKVNFFIEGNGEINADYNKIEVKNATGPEIIIKYHWLETLKTKPELKIEAVKGLDDPVGFIKVYNNNVRDFLIYNAY